MNQMENSILKTIALFDIFSYPLTEMEIFKWLNADKTLINHGWHTDSPQMAHGYSLNNIRELLVQVSDKVQTKNGFYFLAGRESIIAERLRRYGYAEDKFKRAIKFIKIFRCIPFIKMIAVCNTLAYSNSSKEGDIDLFIIAKNNRLWLTRFLVIGLLKLLKVRPTDAQKRDTLDATFFLSDMDLSIEDIKLKTKNSEDIYLTYWVDQIVPIYDVNDTYQKFQEANQWIKNTLPNAIGYQTNQRRIVNNRLFVSLIICFFDYLFNWNFLENLVKKYQLKIMPQVLKEMMNQDTRVVVNDKMLKFHRDDRRQEYQQKFDAFCHLNQSERVEGVNVVERSI